MKKELSNATFCRLMLLCTPLCRKLLHINLGLILHKLSMLYNFMYTVFLLFKQYLLSLSLDRDLLSFLRLSRDLDRFLSLDRERFLSFLSLDLERFLSLDLDLLSRDLDLLSPSLFL